jgi:ABC-type glycerol-3-phosphate transport system substrate-binding protein
MRLRARPLLAASAAVLTITVLATGCSSSDSGGGDGKTVITVEGLPATTKPGPRKAFLDDVKRFEAANPTITVKPTDASWDAQSFATKLAGGNAETVIQVPLTEPQGIIQRRQALDITDQVKQLSDYAKMDQKALSEEKDGSGRIYGLPVNQYALGLVYNRALFTRAGLDPDQPPATWDEVRADAKKIAETGAVGFNLPTTDNFGGWMLTAQTYTRGGRMEAMQGDKYVASVTNDATKQSLEWLHTLRWEDKSTGTTSVIISTDPVRDLATGKLGMSIGAPNTYTQFVTQYNGKKEDFGVSALPQGGANATLAGGTVAMVTAKASQKQAEAAVKWIEFEYLKPQLDPAVAVEQAKAQSAQPGAVVGLPSVPLFDQASTDAIAAAIKPYATVPVDNFSQYLDATRKLTYVAEPPVGAQDLYHALDPVVQALLSRQDVDIDAKLADAQKNINATLQRLQS